MARGVRAGVYRGVIQGTARVRAFELAIAADADADALID